MNITYCPACGEQIDLQVADDATYAVCPLCGKEISTDYEPAYADADSFSLFDDTLL